MKSPNETWYIFASRNILEYCVPEEGGPSYGMRLIKCRRKDRKTCDPPAHVQRFLDLKQHGFGWNLSGVTAERLEDQPVGEGHVIVRLRKRGLFYRLKVSIPKTGDETWIKN